jgi:hypothetical protein
MGDWYHVVKRIKGYPYNYAQRSWREGKRVRTECRCLGRADGGGRSAGGEQRAMPSERRAEFKATTQSIIAARVARALKRVNEISRAPERDPTRTPGARYSGTTTAFAAHGSREGFTGSPRAGRGRYGKGFYLGTDSIAGRYAKYPVGIANDEHYVASAQERGETPDYDGEVSYWDLSKLTLLVLTEQASWWDLCDELGCVDSNNAQDNNDSAQELLAHAGYDGVELRGLADDEMMIVFENAIGKLKRIDDPQHST